MYLTLQVTPNPTYAIQASSNLVNWVTITNVTSPTSPILISDPQAPNFAKRFYRGVAQVSLLSPPSVTTLATTSIQSATPL